MAYAPTHEIDPTRTIRVSLAALVAALPIYTSQEDNVANGETETVEPEETPQEGVEEVEDSTEEQDSQEGFDAEKALAKIRKLNSEAKNLRERAKQAEDAQKDASEKSERVQELESEVLRLNVAIKTGLPAKLATRLQGSTEEELLQDAADLLDMVGGSKPPTDQPKPRLRTGDGPAGDIDPTLDADRFAESIFKN